MENTLENKAKFFALYWGQKCAWVKWPHENEYLGKVSAYSIMWTSYLELKPLSSISNEDVIEVSETVCPEMHAVDYLRSKGYALSYNGLSVEELVNRGWVKLKGETK